MKRVDTPPTLDAAAGRLLVVLARRSLDAALISDRPKPVSSDYPKWLSRPGATFVTLYQQGRLRGCLGSLEAYRPLFDDLCHNAAAAATRDPRFAPVTADELTSIELEVTLLSPRQSLDVTSEAAAAAQLRPGVDGVVLTHGRRSATFLPQVWRSLPEVAEFLAELKRKAGWAADFWHPEMQVSRYSVQKWSERSVEPDAPSPGD